VLPVDKVASAQFLEAALQWQQSCRDATLLLYENYPFVVPMADFIAQVNFGPQFAIDC
jgi:hypothetical protein